MLSQTEKLMKIIGKLCLYYYDLGIYSEHCSIEHPKMIEAITAIKEWALEMVGKDEEIIPERKALANLHTRSYNQRAKEIRDRINAK